MSEPEEEDESGTLHLQGPHGSLSMKVSLMGEGEAVAWTVVAAESGGFKGSSSFQLVAESLKPFVAALDRMRLGENVEAVLEASHYPDFKIKVTAAHVPEFASISGIIGSIRGIAPGLTYRCAVKFGFYFPRTQLNQLAKLIWSNT